MKSNVTSACMALLWLALTTSALGQTSSVQPSSLPSGLVYLNEKVVFHAEDEQHGRTIRAFDIASGTTSMLLNIEPGATNASFEGHMHAAAGYVFFAVRRAKGSVTLFRTDGTAEGTIPLKTFEMGHNDRFRITAPTERHLFFDVYGYTEEERGLWRSDGTVLGTLCLKCDKGNALFETAYLHESGDLIASSRTAGEIIRSDGTVAGTRILAKPYHQCEEITVLGDRVLAQYQSNAKGMELGILDADTGELLEVVDICPGRCDGVVNPNFFPFNDEVIFAADDGAHGRELWTTRGTSESTHMLKDINPGASGSDPYRFTLMDGLVYFVAIESNTGRELWRTEGTAPSTQLVRDIYPGPRSSEPYAFVAHQGALIFTANDGEHGEELWHSVGYKKGTYMLSDIYPGPSGSSPYNTISTPHHLYFSAEEPGAGRELWRSASIRNVAELVADVWRVPTINPGSNPIHLTPGGDNLFFVLNDLEHGAELWATEGDPDDARLVRDIFPGPPSSSPHHLRFFNGLLYFAADNGTHGVELWRSDGSTEGTGLVANLMHGDKSSAPRHLTEAPFHNRLYFVADGLETNIHWINADTGSVSRAMHVGAKGPDWQPRNLRSWNKRLFFTADDGVHGEELWVLQDDTTQLYRDFVKAPVEGVAPDSLTPLGQSLYFSTEAETGERQLGAIRAETEAGTEAGTADEAPETLANPGDVSNENGDLGPAGGDEE